MNRILITTTLLVTAALTVPASADHLDRVRLDFEHERAVLKDEYRARREALHRNYRRTRDILIAERSRAARIDCPETRANRLRANSRELSALARENGHRNRDLTSWYTSENRSLRRAYDLARSSARRVHRPVVIESHRAHPADCACNACRPAVVHERHVTRRHDFGYDYRDDHRVRHSRKLNGFEIAGLILNLLN